MKIYVRYLHIVLALLNQIIEYEVYKFKYTTNINMFNKYHQIKLI